MKTDIPYAFDIARAVLDPARAQIVVLAASYREAVLLPFCQQHQLTYLTGNGRTVFYSSRRRPPREAMSFGSADDAASTPGAPDMMGIFAVLNQEAIGYNDCFGYYVDDVTEADIR